jgi:aryl-alcohol dehydrogenase-like predicted oxidoreductase
VSVPRVELLPGYSISRIIKGGWQLAGGHGAVAREQALDDMQRFVDAGITTFDCADIYTGVEELIGAFLGSLRERQGPAAAAGVQVHTKYVPDRAALATLTGEDVTRAIDRSLRRLGVERLDLVQFHWWDYAVPGHVEAALQLDSLRHAGKIRAIGVTNFDTPHLRELLDAGVPVVSHQLQYSAVDRRPEHGMLDLCRRRGIGLLCYGALLGGFLGERWLDVPPPAEPLENRSLVKYRLILEEAGGWVAFQRLLAALAAIARRHRVGLGAIALSFVLDRTGVAAAIVGARHAGHLDGTLAALRVRLEAEDLRAIDAALAGAPGPAGDVYALEREPGGRHAVIMKDDLNARQGGASG